MGGAVKKLAPIAAIAIGAYAGYAIFGGALGAIRGASLGFRLAGLLGGGGEDPSGGNAGNVGQTEIPDTGQLATAVGEDAWVPKQYGNRRAGMVLVASDVARENEDGTYQIVETGASGAFAFSVYTLGEGPWNKINQLLFYDNEIFKTGQTINFGQEYDIGNNIFNEDNASNIGIEFIQGLLGQSRAGMLSNIKGVDGLDWFAPTDIGNGICYMVVKIKRDKDALIRETAPTNFTIEAEGKKVPDIRLDNSTTQDTFGNYTNAIYTTNPALIALDQLRSSTFGLGLTDTEIDFDAFTDFANYCDNPGTYSDGVSVTPFTLNGQFGQGDSMRQNT